MKKLGENIFAEPRDIIRELIELGYVSEARHYSQENGLVSNEITMEEVRRLVIQSSDDKSKWKDEGYRISIWNQCNHIFRER